MWRSYQVVQDEQLRFHVERDIPSVKQFETTALFLNASKDDRFIWNFQSHHEAVYPSSDTHWELFMQLFEYVRVVWPVFAGLAWYGYIPPCAARIWLMALLVGLGSQATHFLSHARSRGLLTEWPLLEFAQDWHLILHPSIHQRHHTNFNCDFCILNGWGNVLINPLNRFLVNTGVLALDPPTAINRLGFAAKLAQSLPLEVVFSQQQTEASAR